MKKSELAMKWLEKEMAGGNDLAKSYISFLSGAPEPVREHWLDFFWRDAIEGATVEGEQNGKT